MSYGEGFVRRAKCLSVAVWHTGAMLDGSSRLATHYTLCKSQIELARSLPFDSDFTPCVLLVGEKHSPTTSSSASGFTLDHRSDVMSADTKHCG